MTPLINSQRASFPHDTHPLIDRVTALVGVLRRGGLDVPIGAVVDAFAALTHLPLGEPLTVKEGLRATLVKGSDPTAVFDRSFAQLFGGWAANGGLDSGDDGDSAATATSAPAEAAGAMSAAMMSALQRGDAAQLALLAAQAVEQFAGMDSTEGSDRYFLHRVMRALDLSRMLSAAMQQLRREGDLTELELMLRRDEFTRLLEQFRRQLAAEIAARRIDRPDIDAPAPGGAHDADLLSLSPHQLADLRRLVQPLARQLAARIGRHRKPRNTGRLDSRRTVRRSLQSGGVPLDVVLRRRHPHRPEVVLLCDVSGSVAEFAQFTFMLVNALHDELRTVRSFAFVDGIAEVTDLFQTAHFDIPVKRFVERRGVLGDDGHSDYGRVLNRFVERHLGEAVSPRSTVIICGDARGNYRDSGLGALRAIAGKARRLYWLNPEPVEVWDSTDSVMAEYREVCDGVFEVRTLRQLGDVIASLV